MLPEKYGNWNSVNKRIARWCDHGIWEDMHQHIADDPDMENLILGSTVIQAIRVRLGHQKTEVKPNKHSAAAEAGSAPKSM